MALTTSFGRSGRQKPLLGAQLDLSHPLARGLIGCWLFNENAGTSCFDLSASRKPGTFIGTPTWVGGQFGQAIKNNGTDSYVKMPLEGWALTNLTVSFWAYLVDDNSRFQWGEIVSSQTPFILFRTGNIWYVNAGNRITLTLSSSTWLHLAVTYDAVTWRFYVNGIEKGTYSGGTTYQVLSEDLYFGNGYNTFTASSFDAPRVYNRALSAAEVMWLYTEPFAGISQPTYRRWVIPSVAAYERYLLEDGSGCYLTET